MSICVQLCSIAPAGPAGVPGRLLQPCRLSRFGTGPNRVRDPDEVHVPVRTVFSRQVREFEAQLYPTLEIIAPGSVIGVPPSSSTGGTRPSTVAPWIPCPTRPVQFSAGACTPTVGQSASSGSRTPWVFVPWTSFGGSGPRFRLQGLAGGIPRLFWYFPRQNRAERQFFYKRSHVRIFLFLYKSRPQ